MAIDIIVTADSAPKRQIGNVQSDIVFTLVGDTRSNSGGVVGRAKDEWLEVEERGWHDVDAFVCEQCVDDPFLKVLVSQNVCNTTCSFCHSTSAVDIAAPFAIVMTAVASAVFYHFEDPTLAGVPWVDGEPLISPTDTDDVLNALPFFCNDDLFIAVAEAFTNTAWVPAAHGHWASSHRDEALGDSWRTFTQTIKHETRFNFQTVATPEYTSHDDIEPSQMLASLDALIKTANLVQSVPHDTALYRARSRRRPSDWVPSAEELGPPPSTRATSGRMNPAGISYLYTAMDSETAVAEIRPMRGTETLIARFEATRQLIILDLSRLPDIPSIFDEAQRESRENLLFLRGFIHDICAPVAKDGSEHIEYVPSQVVSEFLAQVFQPFEDGKLLDGIVYPSVARAGGTNLVLFPTARGLARKFNTVRFAGFELRTVPWWQRLLSRVLGA